MKEFTSEIEVMKRVRWHENVVTMFGVCKDPIGIVSQYMKAGSLDKLLPTINLDLPTFLRFARGTAAGMVFLHSQGIIHRDIACRNLLVTKDKLGAYTVKITDFGLSRLNDTVQSENSNFGPLKWMAPEALTYKYVKKTDVWSYGVTLVELWTKGDPYPNQSPLHVALTVQNEGKTPEIPPDVPEEVSSIMRSCWKFNPDDRLDFEDILTILDKFLFKIQYRQRKESINEKKDPDVMDIRTRLTTSQNAAHELLLPEKSPRHLKRDITPAKGHKKKKEEKRNSNFLSISNTSL